MMKPLWPTLNLLVLTSASLAAENSYSLKEGETWAINGGIFSHTEPPQNAPQIMIKKADGSIEIIGKTLHQNNQTNIHVDRTGPTINQQWKHTIIEGSQHLIGPDSHLTVSVDEGRITQISRNGVDQFVDTMTHKLTFDSVTTSLQITATDGFNNQSTEKFQVIPDFEAPKLTWQLKAPAINKDNTWYASKQATLAIQTNDPNGIDYILLNGQKTDPNTNELTANMGDTLSIKDKLGNIRSETLTWQQDDQAPYAVILINGRLTTSESRISVKTGDVIEITTHDQGVGIKEHRYKGVSRKWKPLPQKIRFNTQGNSKIKIFSEDAVGNQIEQTLKFKVKR